MAEKEQVRPKTTLILLIILIFLALLFAYWYFFLNPSWIKINEKRAELSSLNREIDNLMAEIASKPELEQELNRLREEEEELYTLLPPESGLPRILGNLENMVYEAPVYIKHFDASQMILRDWYYEIPILLEVHGAVEDLHNLLEQVEQFLHMALTHEVRIEWDDNLKTHKLTVDFILIAIAGEDSEESTGEDRGEDSGEDTGEDSGEDTGEDGEA